jgi:hypothetical protein
MLYKFRCENSIKHSCRKGVKDNRELAHSEINRTKLVHIESSVRQNMMR